ncbi:MAG TPA: DUF6716 putative glycosyltransferase [Actinopolymorphaceae bacterium]|jgi:hypothetical protein
MTARRVRVLVVADSDSYLKWGASLLTSLPAAWDSDVVVVRNPVAPVDDQISDAVGAGVVVARLSMRALVSRLRDDPPDAVVLACTGPMAQVLLARPELREGPRPVVVAGLPGIAVPASEKAWLLRRGVDVFVVHSRRERDEAGPVNGAVNNGSRRAQVVLARLPFLQPSQLGGRQAAATRGAGAAANRVVFATQAKVPVHRTERTDILRALAVLGRRRPDLDVVVKVRARSGQAQTHHERHPYQDLWAGMLQRGEADRSELRFATGPMAEHLACATGLMTVSSTAALEAIAADVSVLILSDFGVDAQMINEVFVGSGLLGSLADLRSGRFHRPDPRWAERNYLHAAAADNLAEVLEALVERRRLRGLVARAATPATLRSRVRAIAPAPAVRAVSRARRQWQGFAKPA